VPPSIFRTNFRFPRRFEKSGFHRFSQVNYCYFAVLQIFYRGFAPLGSRSRFFSLLAIYIYRMGSSWVRFSLSGVVSEKFSASCRYSNRELRAKCCLFTVSEIHGRTRNFNDCFCSLHFSRVFLMELQWFSGKHTSFLGAGYIANFRPGWNFGPPTGLKFCCDYMANFSHAHSWVGKFAGKRLTFTTQAVRMPKFIFSPGWNLNAINTYMLFDGLTYNTRGYFASCVVFLRAPKGAGINTSNEQNVRAYYMLSHRIRHLVFHLIKSRQNWFFRDLRPENPWNLDFTVQYIILLCSTVAYFVCSLDLIW